MPGLLVLLFLAGASSASAHVIASTGYSTVHQDGSRVTWLLSLEYDVLGRAKAIQPVAGANWSQHHGDESHSGVATDAIAASQRLAWSYRTKVTFLTGSPAHPRS